MQISMLHPRANTQRFIPPTVRHGISNTLLTLWRRSPYMAPDGSIAYNESIVKKLPPTPRRKDKI